MKTTLIMRPDILTISGNYFDFITPDKSKFSIEDIAHGLSHVCRFAGQCKPFYSVAQHSVMVSRIVPFEDALAGLMHDAAEAFIGDVSAPLKQLLPEYKLIEKRVENAIFNRFGLNLPMPKSVKHADLVMLATEQRDFMPPHNDDWALIKEITPLTFKLEAVDSLTACSMFIERYNQITGRLANAA